MGNDEVRWRVVGMEECGEGERGEPADELGDDEGRDRRGSMPAKVSVSVRATVTAGLANDVDEVNQ